MLKQKIENYISLHKTVGFKFKQQAYQLRSYANYAKLRGEKVVSSQSALEWAKEAPSACSRTERLRVIRRFASTVIQEDSSYEVPPKIDFGKIQRRKPHIFTTQNISNIITAALALNPKNSFRSRTYATLFALLSSTGLRISEALALQIEEVTEVGLVVKKTKFRKNRLVPLHPTATQALNQYMIARKKVIGESSTVFVSSQGKHLAYPTVISTFLAIVRRLGIHPGVGLPGPRIHDFRHTFAVRSLEQCPQGRDKIHRHMHALSTYLGHAHMSDTYWYLHTTPKLLVDISESAERMANGDQQ